MPTALVYVRKSVVKANKPTLSPQRQEEACRQFCGQKGWTVEVYADAEGHRSGRSEKKRPEWLRLKERLSLSRPGEITAVVVNVMDRTSRSTRDFLNFLHLLQEKQADFISTTQPFLDTTSAVGRAFVAMVSIWAQLEADMDSERVIADAAFRQESGIHVGNAPIGYIRQLVNGHRIPVPDATAPKVVQIWEAYATGEYSYRSLARWVNNVLQFPTRSGDLWTHKHVQIMFDNYLFYTGWVTRHRKRGGTERYRGKHPAIISDELAAKVLEVRASKEDIKLKLRYGRPAKQEYLLTPILYCATCGQRLRAIPSHGRNSYKHESKSACGWSIVSAATIERDVLGYFHGWELPPDLFREVEDELVEDIRRHKAKASDAKKLKQLGARKEKALKLYEFGLRDETWLHTTINEIDRAIRQLTPVVPLPYNPRALSEMVRQFGTLIAAESTPRGTVKQLLYTMLERVEIANGAIVTLQPRPWFLQFFRDCTRVANGNKVVPPGEHGSRFVAGLEGILSLAR